MQGYFDQWEQGPHDAERLTEQLCRQQATIQTGDFNGASRSR